MLNHSSIQLGGRVRQLPNSACTGRRQQRPAGEADSLGCKAQGPEIGVTHKAGIRLTDKRSGDISEHVVEFSAEEWSQLHSYLEHVRELEATRFAREGGGVSLNLQWKEGSGLSWSVTMPPADDLSALLHRLRPLILQSEPASFVKVRKLLERKLKDAPIGPLIRFLLDLYSGKELQKLIVMQSNDQIMNSEEMLFTWLNAREYTITIGTSRSFSTRFTRCFRSSGRRGCF